YYSPCSFVHIVELSHCIVHCRAQHTLLGGTMLSFISRLRWQIRVIPALTVAMLFTLVAFPALVASAATLHLSTDPFTQATCAASSTTNHHTEVEPDTYSNGSTIVATFQVARIFDGGLRHRLCDLHQQRRVLDQRPLARHYPVAVLPGRGQRPR